MPLKSKFTGKLISFEGSEGSGKSTQIARPRRASPKGPAREVVATREPGRHRDRRADPEHHRPQLPRRRNVSRDRTPAVHRGPRSGGARGHRSRPRSRRGGPRATASSTPLPFIRASPAISPPVRSARFNRFAVGNVMPDLTVVIDVPTEVSLQRVRQRASDLPDRMERENITFYKKVREGYLLLAQQWPERVVVLDGTLSPDALDKKIWAVVQKRLG
ncbi:MAG: dTMP kinase [Lacunisphaera sp.]